VYVYVCIRTRERKKSIGLSVDTKQQQSKPIDLIKTMAEKYRDDREETDTSIRSQNHQFPKHKHRDAKDHTRSPTEPRDANDPETGNAPKNLRGEDGISLRSRTIVRKRMVSMNTDNRSDDSHDDLPDDLRREPLYLSRVEKPPGYCICTRHHDGYTSITMVDCEDGSTHRTSKRWPIPPTCRSVLVPHAEIVVVDAHLLVDIDGDVHDACMLNDVCATKKYVVACPSDGTGDSIIVVSVASSAMSIARVVVPVSRYRCAPFDGDHVFAIWSPVLHRLMMLDARAGTVSHFCSPLPAETVVDVVEKRAIYCATPTGSIRAFFVDRRGVVGEKVVVEKLSKDRVVFTGSGMAVLPVDGMTCVFSLESPAAVRKMIGGGTSKKPVDQIFLPISADAIVAALGPRTCIVSSGGKQPTRDPPAEKSDYTIADLAWPLYVVNRNAGGLTLSVLSKPRHANDGVSVVPIDATGDRVCVYYTYDIHGNVPGDVPDNVWHVVDAHKCEKIWCYEVIDIRKNERDVARCYSSTDLLVAPTIAQRFLHCTIVSK
jgi:hypothetical protein